MFSYQGICKHNLASPCMEEPSLPYFQVFGRNENRRGITSVSYPLYVEIVFNGKTVRLIKSGTLAAGIPVNAMFNGNYIQIPYIDADFKLFYNGPYAHYVASCGLSVDFDGDWSIIVNVPAEYNGKMCGLCGNNDNNPNNDLTLANGTFVGNFENGANLFGDSYLVDDPENTDASICPAPPPPPPCDSTTYETFCGHMKDTSGMLSPCISRLVPGVADAYYENCK
jgi:hypothetical protein